METNNKKLKQYFLEQLPPQEVEEIELQIISDADFSAELETAETELMEDYLENSLNTVETKLFETNYLITEERNKKLQFLKSLKQFAQKKVQNLETQNDSPSFFESLKAIFAPRGFAVVFGFIILTLVLALIWRIYSPTENINPEIATLNQKDFSNLEEFKVFTNLGLISGNLRSGGGQSVLNLKDLRENVFFRLALPPKTSLVSIFKISVTQDKKSIANLDKVKVYGGENSQEVRLLLPAKFLQIGEYQIELKSESSPESKIIYNFAVR